MGEVSWGKPKPYTVFEIRTNTPSGYRYEIAKLLVYLAARIINSGVICKKTLSVLEAR